MLFADMAEVGANPARIIAAWHEFVDEHGAGGRAIRGIGEPIWAGRSDSELAECHRHESLLNLAFADTPAFRLLCPYDVSALDPGVVEEAERTHPFMSDVDSFRESGSYRGLEAISAPFADPLDDPPASAARLTFDADSLGAVRDLVTDRAEKAGFDRETTDALVLAVNEIATNSIRHGGGFGAHSHLGRRRLPPLPGRGRGPNRRAARRQAPTGARRAGRARALAREPALRPRAGADVRERERRPHPHGDRQLACLACAHSSPS